MARRFTTDQTFLEKEKKQVMRVASVTMFVLVRVVTEEKYTIKHFHRSVDGVQLAKSHGVHWWMRLWRDTVRVEEPASVSS